MKPVQTITLQFIRTYRGRLASAGIRSKVKLLTEDKESKIKLEDLNEGDPEIYELDFVNADESSARHDRKVEKSAKLLPHRITKSKYFKELEPSFLTFVEKNEIKKLHDSDPEEWTPEKLSQSFPALPHAIKKVLKSHWVPKSVDAIIRYDSKVIENWKNFKTDKLVVSPALKEHLMKFRQRKISLLDRESLEKFIPPPIVLPKPKSNFFSRMIEEKTDNTQHECSEQSVSLKNTERHLITDGKKTMETYTEKGNNYSQVALSKRVHNERSEKLMFTDFMKKKLDNLDETSPEEREVLLSTYRKHIETVNVEDVSKNISDNDTKCKTNEKDVVKENLSKNNASTVQSKNESAIEVKKDMSKNNTLSVQSKNESEVEVKKDLSKNNALAVQSSRQSEIAVETRVEYKGLETYVKERVSLMDTNFDYIKRIKIPKNAFKKGMTYRIKDCYYDDDGEFLYRTPGLKT
ncbi:uncharacterized protein LOC100878278 [Megachile rotundata]|uniref:uncharacterized protein LOC100878278 n=1 Tax=Megachile rotundata TaxID=143995 RepID=UPI000614F9D3|nr:PREDICTED: uncharacterized protein LOC100878278 [Megachile rotundata]XP_012135571.1 PREDICTED: uncharacterized protein LOC100878278 [Megachile rotundata]